jgi:ribosomal protein L11 methyltransferase
MSWWAVDVRPAPERRAALGEWLVVRTGQAIEERDDGTLVTFADSEPAANALIAEIQSVHQVSAGARALDPIDWSVRWRDGIESRRFGRLTVSPSWLASAAHDRLTVIIDPETAFGSGEHGSTRAALTLLERRVSAGDRVLDLGSGSGILAIAAVRLGAERAIGIETDAESNVVASRNAEINGVDRATSFVEGDAAVMAPLLGPAELLLSNILRTVNTLLIPSITAALRPGGVAIFSGMESAEAPLFRPVLETAGYTALDEIEDAGWWAIAVRRRG